jgi:hypothetical protein
MKLLFKICSNVFVGRRVSLEDNDSLIESVLVTQTRRVSKVDGTIKNY